MKIIRKARILSVSLLIFKTLHTANAQGTIAFNDPWINNGVGYFSLTQFDGFSFGVGNRVWPYDNMIHIGATGPSGYPHNGSPFVAFNNTFGTSQYVVFAWTNWPVGQTVQPFTDGAPFGLVSVDLADPLSPSPSSVSVTFNGFKSDGSTVSQTFTVGGGGSSSFQSFTFNSSFASDLVRVEIPSPAWAMDNLVLIPEPSSWALMVIGACLLRFARFRRPLPDSEPTSQVVMRSVSNSHFAWESRAVAG